MPERGPAPATPQNALHDGAHHHDCRTGRACGLRPAACEASTPRQWPPSLLVFAVTWLVFGWQLNVWLPFDGGASLAPHIVLFAPIAAAWALDHHGPRLLVPIAAAALVPSIWFSVVPDVGFGLLAMPLAILLLATVAGGWYAALRDPTTWSALVHERRVGLLYAAIAIIVVARFEWPSHAIGTTAPGVTIDGAGAVAALLMTAVVDWRALAAAGGTRTTAARLLVRFGLPLLLVAAVGLRLHVGIGPSTISWGHARALPAVAPILLLLMLTAGRRRRWIVLMAALVAVLAAVLAAEAWRLHAGMPPLVEIPRSLGRPTSIDEVGRVGCNLAAAALLALALQHALREPTAWRGMPWLPLAGIVGVQLVLRPLLAPGSGFYAIDAMGWTLAGVAFVAFVAALVRGAPGLVVAPLALASAVLVVPMLAASSAPARLLCDAAGLAATAALAGFGGLLLHRARTPAIAARRAAAGLIGIDRIANFVHRLDTSATLQSFGRLLIVLGVGFALVQTGALSMIAAAWEDIDALDGDELLIVTALLAAVALLPLAFIVVDAVHRSDR